MTLIEFLRARLDEWDPTVADAWRLNDEDHYQYLLAAVIANRRIIEIHEGAHECPMDDDNCGWVDGDLRPYCDTLRLLALPFAYRSDYRDEWRI